MFKTRFAKILLFLLVILILITYIYFFIKKQENINPKVFYNPSLVKINTEFNRNKDSFVGDEEEISLVSKYILINLFTISDMNGSNIKKIDDFIDGSYIEYFNKQYNNNIGDNIKRFAKMYKAENLPKVSEVKLTQVNNDYEGLHANDKKLRLYNIKCKLLYKINDETTENKILSEKAVSKWPASLILKIYWDDTANKWKIAELNNIVTNDYYQD